MINPHHRTEKQFIADITSRLIEIETCTASLKNTVEFIYQLMSPTQYLKEEIRRLEKDIEQFRRFKNES